MRLVSWNVNGVRAVTRKGLFAPFLQELDPDVFCFQETKADKSQCEVDFPGYEEHWNSAEKKGYSGTAIFSKTSPIRVTPGLPQDIIDKFGVEGDVFGDPNKEG